MFNLFTLILAAMIPIIAGAFLFQLYFEVDKAFKSWFIIVLLVLGAFVLSYIAEGIGLLGLDVLGPYIRRPLVSVLIMVLLPLLWAIKPCLIRNHMSNNHNGIDSRTLAEFDKYYRRIADRVDSLPETQAPETTDRS